MSNFISIFKYFYSEKSIVVRFFKPFYDTVKRVTTMTTMHCSHFCSQVLKPFFKVSKQKRELTTRKVIWDYMCAHETILQNIVVRVYRMIREYVKYIIKPDYKHDYKLTTFTTILLQRWYP